MWRCTPRIVFHDVPDFNISFELVDLGRNQLMPMIHLEVKRFDKAVYSAIHEAIKQHRPRFPEILYCQPSNDTPLFSKFVSRFGFSPLGDGYCNDGINRRIYVNYDKGNR